MARGMDDSEASDSLEALNGGERDTYGSTRAQGLTGGAYLIRLEMSWSLEGLCGGSSMLRPIFSISSSATHVLEQMACSMLMSAK